MSGICSKHQGYDPNRVLCQKTPEDLFSNWKQMKEEALHAGIHVRVGVQKNGKVCGFVYYKTISFCPRCGTAGDF